MKDDSSRFNSENLPKYRWKTFFKELLESRVGQPVNILEGSDFLHAEITTPSAPLTAIEYDSHHEGRFKHKGLLTFTTGGSHGETVTINVPTIVWVYENLEGTLEGIEVIDEKDNHVVVRFTS